MKAIRLCLLVNCLVLVASQSSKHDSPLHRVHLWKNNGMGTGLPLLKNYKQMITNVNAPGKVTGPKLNINYLPNSNQPSRRHYVGKMGSITMKGIETSKIENPKPVVRRKLSRRIYGPNKNLVNLNINTSPPSQSRRFLVPVLNNSGRRYVKLWKRRSMGTRHFRRQNDVNSQDTVNAEVNSNENAVTSEVRESSPVTAEFNSLEVAAEKVNEEQATAELSSPEVEAEQATAEQATAEVMDGNDHLSDEAVTAEATQEVTSEVGTAKSSQINSVESVEDSSTVNQDLVWKMCEAANQNIAEFWKVVSNYLGLNGNKPKNLEEIKKLYIILRLYIELSKHKHLDRIPLNDIIDEIIKGLTPSIENDDLSDQDTDLSSSDSDFPNASEQQSSTSTTTPNPESSGENIDDVSNGPDGQINELISSIVDNLNSDHTIDVEDLNNLISKIVLSLVPVGPVTDCQEKAYVDLLENLRNIVGNYLNAKDCNSRGRIGLLLMANGKRRLLNPNKKKFNTNY